MRKISLTFILLALMMLQGVAQTTTWEVFKSVDGKFQVLTPGEMTKKENSISTDIGELNYITFLYQPAEEEADNFVYLVSYCDYPVGAIHSDSSDFVKDFFRTTIETSIESVNGELKYSSEVDLDDYPGMLWRVDYNEETAMIKTKALMVENRYYSIQVISQKEKGLNLYIDKFIDSFSLL